MKSYSYVRVSSVDQNVNRQMDALLGLKIPMENVFIEKQSGKDFERPMYRKLLRKLKQGDVLYLHSLDRLGRNYEEILSQWRVLTKEKGADIVVLDMEILDTRKDKNLMGTAIADVVLILLSYVAENERVAIRRRQSEGIASAKSRGVKFGRPVKEVAGDFQGLVKEWKEGRMTRVEALKAVGISQASFYRRVREMCAGGGAKKINPYHKAYFLIRELISNCE